ncbi:dTDP-4-dehydrorhamnose reductase [Chitinophaga sp. GCM10012297]|uniref:dTDP-4-dehydrorhamnose reductase n=1 Tax=Chitinophaga chungangae TaxID=2821488 RepID=A0ABS3Y7S2_9BACT|nr:dTDP-4-dehydrorhamnose reductase [Chitinophaga chungangae]MBO9150727.1 dTDP-4-dehydrorhamnose reductase [Chitinophaga chungangae]
MKHILVTGANGQLGQALRSAASQYPGFELIYTGRDELDITDAAAVNAFFESRQIDAVINCAGYTAVDKAEQDEEAAFLLNFQAPLILAEAAAQHNSAFVQVSTDYVFDGRGNRPYTEKDETSAQSVYGASKLRGEAAVLGYHPNAIIVRTSWLYSRTGVNFVLRMQELMKERESLNVVFDQTGTPTYAPDLAHAILTILGHPSLAEGGIYHYSNEGVASWYDFAMAIKELTGSKCAVNPITSDQYPTPAQRPAYSVLNKEKIKSVFGLEIPYWKDSLAVCLGK